MEVTPAKKSRVMTVVKMYFYGIVANGLDVSNIDVVFSYLQRFLSWAVSFYFRWRRVNAKEFRSELEVQAVFKAELEDARDLVEINFSWFQE